MTPTFPRRVVQLVWVVGVERKESVAVVVGAGVWFGLGLRVRVEREGDREFQSFSREHLERVEWRRGQKFAVGVGAWVALRWGMRRGRL